MKRVAARRTNAEWSAGTQTAILTAARRAFAAHGYDDASTEAIATAAGVTKGALYHHYKDKRQLFRAVVEALQREIVTRIERVAFAQANPLEGVAHGCDAFLDVVRAPEIGRIVLLDGPRVLGWQEWRRIDAEASGQSLREGLEAAMEAGQMVRMDSGVLLMLLSGALNEAALICCNQPRRRAVVKKTIRRILEALRA